MTPIATQAKLIAGTVAMMLAIGMPRCKTDREVSKLVDECADIVQGLLVKYQDELLEEQRQTGVALAEALNAMRKGE